MQGSSGLLNGDALSGELATSATTTSNVGSYGITQGTLRRVIKLHPDLYRCEPDCDRRAAHGGGGCAIAALWRHQSHADLCKGSGLLNGDALSGGLATSATTTSNVGNYGITQGTLAASSNYTLTYSSANLTVRRAPLTVTADAQSRRPMAAPIPH